MMGMAPRWQLRDRTLELDQPVGVGIVNVTDDSMFEGSRISFWPASTSSSSKSLMKYLLRSSRTRASRARMSGSSTPNTSWYMRSKN